VVELVKLWVKAVSSRFAVEVPEPPRTLAKEALCARLTAVIVDATVDVAVPRGMLPDWTLDPSFKVITCQATSTLFVVEIRSNVSCVGEVIRPRTIYRDSIPLTAAAPICVSNRKAVAVFTEEMAAVAEEAPEPMVVNPRWTKAPV
jgi:hypothetical protein